MVSPVDSPAAKKLCRSERQVIITPEKYDQIIADLLKGQPPHGKKKWSKETLIKSLTKLEGTRKTKTFIRAVLASGKSEYKTNSAIYQLYNNWKEKKVVPASRGRPPAITMNEAQGSVKNVLQD